MNATTKRVPSLAVQHIRRTNEFMERLMTAIENEKPEPPAVIQTAPAKEFLNVKEAAEFTGYSTGHIHNLIHGQKIPCYRPGGDNGHVFLCRSDLEKFMQRNKQSADYEIEEEAAAILNEKPQRRRRPSQRKKQAAPQAEEAQA